MTAQLGSALLFGAAALALASLGGCALVPATILPAVAGAAPVAVEDRGTRRRDSFWLAHYGDVVEAVLGAGEVLALELKEYDAGEQEATLRFADARDEEITVRIERRTETVTWARFDVDSDNNLGMATLLGRQTIDELKKANAFLVDWSDKSTNPTE